MTEQTSTRRDDTLKMARTLSGAIDVAALLADQFDGWGESQQSAMTDVRRHLADAQHAIGVFMAMRRSMR